MTTLPSFVELMSSLGLDHIIITPDQGTSSPAISPHPRKPQHIKSKSTPCFREANTFRDRQRVVRYSPYSPALSISRRGSLSSSSSASCELDRVSLRASSTSPHPASSPRFSRRSYDKLFVGPYGSASDLSANTPISTYVRRKTPGPSPTSPTFPRESQYDSDTASHHVVIVPTLPTLIHSPPSSSDSFHTAFSESELLSREIDNDSSVYSGTGVIDISSRGSRRSHRSAGVRISSPPSYPRSRSLAPMT